MAAESQFGQVLRPSCTTDINMSSSAETVPPQQPFLAGLQSSPPYSDSDIQELREWLQTQLHLPPLSDDHFQLFLHSCYGKMQKTKTTIESYYTLRSHSPELFANRDPLAPELQKMLDLTNMVAMPISTSEGYRVLLYRLVVTEPSKLHFTNAMRLFFMFNDMQLSEDGLAPGYIVVLDMCGISWGHLMRINLSAIRKFMVYIQDCHPARLKGVHVINTVAFMDKVLAIVKPFMKSELVRLLHLHGPAASLSRFFPLSLLPEDYGGEAELTQSLHDKQRRTLETRYVRWMQDEETLRVDESQRHNCKQHRQEQQQQQQQPPQQQQIQQQAKINNKNSFRHLSID